MKNFIFFCILLITCIKSGFGQYDTLEKYKLYAGLNLLRIAAGDIESQFHINYNDKFTLGIAAGYDFNFLDYMEPTDDTVHHSISKEESNKENSRYLYGKGAVLRIYFDYAFPTHNNRQHFISLEALLKKRNYINYPFGDNVYVYQESANQNILGLTAYYGTNYSINKSLTLRFYYGIGFRYLDSHITRPADYVMGYYRPERHFIYNMIIPSLHIGIAIFSKL